FFDAGGNLIGTVTDTLPRPTSGITSDDRFVGMYHAGGISAMRLSGPGAPGNSAFELDHLQYGSIVQPVGDIELWYLDSGGGGPLKINDLGYQPNFSAANVNGAIYFTRSDAATGNELWKYDANDFTPVADINPGSASSDPRALTAVDGTLYFVAD